MLRKILYFIFLLPICICANAYHINWLDSADLWYGQDCYQVQSFDDAAYLDASHLPYFIHTQVLSADEINNFDFSVILSEKYSEESTVLLNQDLTLDVTYSVSSTTSSSRNYHTLEIKMLPYRIENGVVKRLVDFELDIQKTQKSSLKSNSVNSTDNTERFADESVLANGHWVKVGVEHDAIYKLSYADLSDLGIDPNNISVFTSTAGKLSSMIDDYIDDLKEVAIYDNGDFILFYGQSHNTWDYNSSTSRFTYTAHPYWNENYYFITSDAGEKLRIADTEAITESSTYDYTTFVDYQAVKYQDVSVSNSGDDRYSESYISSSTYSHTFTFDNIVEQSANLNVNLAYNTPGSGSYMQFSVNDNLLSSSSLSTIGETAARLLNKTLSFTPESSNITVQLTPNTNYQTSQYWIDYVSLNVTRPLTLVDDVLMFRNKPLSNAIASYTLSNTQESTVVWDVSDPFFVNTLSTEQNSTQLSFKTEGNSVKQFAAINVDGTFETPTIYGEIENQNLHGEDLVNMVIISPVEFFEQAEELADVHREEGLTVLVINQEKIFNEFSGGKADVTAIRWFLKMFYDKSLEEDGLQYLLLFGDGDVDNRLYEDGSSIVMTYESDDSYTEDYSYVSDDYFGLLDDTEGDNIDSSDKVDIGIGRIPVRTSSEAQSIVDKIKYYLTQSKSGDWRNKLCFLADDQNSNAFVSDMEITTSALKVSEPAFSLNKVYLDAFEQTVENGSYRYPEATAMSEKYLDEGVLVWAYSGHGSPNQLADEILTNTSAITKMNNLDVLPLWMTATCDFGPFDHNDDVSAGEEVLLNSTGGAIGVFTTTRLVYITPNQLIVNSFFDYVLAKNTYRNERNRLGDAVRLAKCTINTGANQRKYCLLGDPALKLLTADEGLSVRTERINDKLVEEMSDTLTSLSTVTISGYIENEATVDTEFNGVVYATLYDKEETLMTLANDSVGDNISFSQSFNIWNTTLYKGEIPVINGRFEFTFIVPKDIDYSIGKGRVEYYAVSDNGDANGYFEDFYIGGFNDDYEVDTVGPEVDSYMNTTNFKNGDKVNASPMFMADVSDKSGINTSSAAIGHDITLMLNNDPNEITILNSNYTSEIGDFTKGQVAYQLNDLDNGSYTLSFKIWDVHNNSSTSEINFVVDYGSQPQIFDVTCSPNPVSLSSTEEVKFVVTHDRPSSTLSSTLKIYSIDGRLVHTLTEFNSSSDELLIFTWPVAETPLKEGIYLYKVSVNDGVNTSSGVAHRLIISN